MVQLVDSDIRTREVLEWKGLHVFHFAGSACSQKLRIYLNVKGIPWESHVIDLAVNENWQPWYLGINPRGLVPAIVHNGAVHIESNDIIEYLERTFTQPRLIPPGMESKVNQLLRHEDDLHLDLRTLSFRFVFDRPGAPKPAAALAGYASNGAGTVGGVADPEKRVQIEYWERAAREGFPDAACRRSAQKFRAEFDQMNEALGRHAWLLGADLTVLDIAWFIYAVRLSNGGYPIHRLHPRVGEWLDRLAARPEFAREVAMPPEMRAKNAEARQRQAAAGSTLEQVAGF